jgi:hypothetical protein
MLVKQPDSVQASGAGQLALQWLDGQQRVEEIEDL